MYIDENGYKFKGIVFFKEENPDYFAGWYFVDECEQLNGPFANLAEARKELRIYNQHLSQKKFDYDTFSNSRIYKTLPYIVDRVNEMEKYKQAQVSKYFNTLNKVCNNLNDMRLYRMQIDNIRYIVDKKKFNLGYTDVTYYKNLTIEDFIKKIDKQFSEYDPTFVSHLKNFTKAKIGKLQ